MSPALWEALKEAGRKGGLLAARKVWAADRASNADGRTAGYRGLDAILKREPYASEWAQVEDEFVSQFVDVLHESAQTPEVIREFDKKTGRLVRERVSRRDMNWAALMVLRRYSPEWRERRAITVDGAIQHEHRLGAPADEYRLSSADVLALPAEKQRLLFELLGEVEELRAERALEERNGGVTQQQQRALPPVEGEAREVEPG